MFVQRVASLRKLVVAGTAEVSRFRLCILFSQIVAGTILRHALAHPIGSVLLA